MTTIEQRDYSIAKAWFKIGLGVIVSIFVLIAGCQSVEIVKTGYVGLKVRYGKVQDGVLQPGFYMMNPVTTDIEQMYTQVLRWNGKTETYTRDVQQATISFTTTYALDQAHADYVLAEVGHDWSQKLVSQVVVAGIKDELGQHNAVDLIARRNEAAEHMRESIKKGLASVNILLNDFQITDIGYDPRFEKSVEDKVVAQQRAIEEQNRTVQIEEQAKQKIKTAEGDKQALILNAEGESRSIQLKNEALANSPRLIEYQALLEWNGAMPQTLIVGDTKSIPFINVPMAGGK